MSKAVSNSLDIELMYSPLRPLYFDSFVLPLLSCSMRPCIGMHRLFTLFSRPTILRAFIPRLDRAKLMERPALMFSFRKSDRLSITLTLYPLCPRRKASKDPHRPAPIMSIFSSVFNPKAFLKQLPYQKHLQKNCKKVLVHNG